MRTTRPFPQTKQRLFSGRKYVEKMAEQLAWLRIVLGASMLVAAFVGLWGILLGIGAA